MPPSPPHEAIPVYFSYVFIHTILSLILNGSILAPNLRTLSATNNDTVVWKGQVASINVSQWISL